MTITAAAQAARQHARQQAEQDPEDQTWQELAAASDELLAHLTEGLTDAAAVEWIYDSYLWHQNPAPHTCCAD